jgi:hypothetical protein
MISFLSEQPKRKVQLARIKLPLKEKANEWFEVTNVPDYYTIMPLANSY